MQLRKSFLIIGQVWKYNTIIAKHYCYFEFPTRVYFKGILKYYTDYCVTNLINGFLDLKSSEESRVLACLTIFLISIHVIVNKEREKKKNTC